MGGQQQDFTAISLRADPVTCQDYDLTYDCPGNRFRYLGNGFALRELEADPDLSWYITQPDEMVVVRLDEGSRGLGVRDS
jgi:hypothetical protein